MPSVESATAAFTSAVRAPARDTRSLSQGVEQTAEKGFSSLLDESAARDDDASPRTQSKHSESRQRRDPVASNATARRPANSASTESSADADGNAGASVASGRPNAKADDPTIELSADEADMQADGATTTEAGASAADSAASGSETTAVVDAVIVPVMPPPVALVATPTTTLSIDDQAAGDGSVEAPCAHAEAAATAAAATADARAVQPAAAEPIQAEAAATASAAPVPQAPAANPTVKSSEQPAKGTGNFIAVDAAQDDASTDTRTQAEAPAATAAQPAKTQAQPAATTMAERANDRSAAETQTSTLPPATARAGLETLQPLPVNTQSAAQASASATPTQQASASVPVSGIAVEVATRAQAGNNRFEIRLDPPELGRIDVHLDVDRHGKVTSHLVVERSETLDLLRRDAPNLERALQDAGLKTGDSALQFSLRDQGAGADRDAREARPTDLSEIAVSADETETVQALRSYRWSGTTSGIDIRV